MSHGEFVTAINCMDGRTQEPVVAYMKKKHGADYVDMVTEPGPIGALAASGREDMVESVKRRVGISVNAHGSKVIAVFGHHDCAGNPVDADTQKRQIKASMELIRSWGFGCEVEGGWVGADWTVSAVE